MEELSIFIDESGDFGKYDEKSPFYIVSLVLHEQKNPISEQVNKLNLALEEIGLINHTIHTAPLIRKEQSYSKTSIKERYKIFNKLFHFTRNVDIKFKNLIIDKKHCSNQINITATISKQLIIFIKENLEYFIKFDNIIIYYDSGQIQLTNILVAVFYAFFSDNFEYRGVFPRDYKLFQTADLICTLALINHKLTCKKNLTKSEEIFFGSAGKFKKNYLKHLKKLEF